ncbi:MAG: metalloregulator ArsR/SmtB family transcription factor, partial [Acidobacteriota bacterium]
HRTRTMERPAILERAGHLAEMTRSRLLLALDAHELTVGEMCAILQLPQSTVSRHLKILADGGWVESRRDGTSNLYRLASLDETSSTLWALVRDEITKTADADQDRRRLETVLQKRRSRSQEFFSSTADDWDRLRDDLFGRRFDLEALLGLMDPGWRVGDLGCGTGRTTRALAPFVREVVAIDGSSAMLDAARMRLADCDNVRLKNGDLERLPLADQSLDAATLILALHHVPDPQQVLREAHRVLRPGGRFVALDMLPHGHEEYRQEMGHVWLGFEEGQMRAALESCGFTGLRFAPLRPDPTSKGPSLFVISAGAGEVRDARTGTSVGQSASTPDALNRLHVSPSGPPAAAPDF